MASESEQEKRETLADIVRKKRSMAAEIRANLSTVPVRREDQLLEADSLDREADRIETAWKRERADAVGNAEAMREALLTIRKRLVAAYVSESEFMRLSPDKPLVDLIDAALSAPARNCDMYDNWYDAHQAWERLPKDELGYFVDANGVHECEHAWLLAPAAERKGEGDENK